MKNWMLFFSMVTLLILSSCNRHQGHHSSMDSKMNHLWGDNPDAALASEGLYGPQDEDFIPLQDEDLQTQFSELAIAQPRDIPGEPGSGIPTLDKFREAVADLAKVFQNVFFNTDDYMLRKADHFKVVDCIASYLKDHPKIYVSIEGHCDERASEAYNLSLGTRRANYVRSLIVQKGIDPNRIHTISFGKEKPADDGHNQSAWSKNRRVEFRIYEKD